MAVKLDTCGDKVDTAAAEFEPMLKNLQANILKPHGRTFARHVFLQFKGSRDAVRTWLQDHVVPRVTSAKDQLDGTARRRVSGGDGGLVSGFFLSARGYTYLGFPTDGFASTSFKVGMKDQENGPFAHLLDLTNQDPPPERWEPGFRAEIHALVTFADAQESVVEDAAEALRRSADPVVKVLCTEKGNVLRRALPHTPGKSEPVEHFGYFDGISQPLFTRQDLEEDKLVNPRTGEWDPAARLSLVLVDDPLTSAIDAFGSYLVYRKLSQDVARFEEEVAKLARTLGVEPELAGAFIVGRHKDGTPLARTKAATAAGDYSKDNDFNYAADDDGVRCPFHAHIRKTNPRGTTPITTLPNEKRRRVVRRGIPYGLPRPGVADNLPTDANPTTPRGLLFMCFQANVEEQFEFIQRTWVDNKHFPTAVLTIGLLQPDTGNDPLIGQDRDEAQRWPKRWGDENAGKKTINFESAVTLEGGEYFFAPSLPFLHAL